MKSMCASPLNNLFSSSLPLVPKVCGFYGGRGGGVVGSEGVEHTKRCSGAPGSVLQDHERDYAMLGIKPRPLTCITMLSIEFFSSSGS